jgi:hypothetical protein
MIFGANSNQVSFKCLLHVSGSKVNYRFVWAISTKVGTSIPCASEAVLIRLVRRFLFEDH